MSKLEFKPEDFEFTFRFRYLPRQLAAHANARLAEMLKDAQVVEYSAYQRVVERLKEALKAEFESICDWHHWTEEASDEYVAQELVKLEEHD